MERQNTQPGENGATFTQADVDRIVGERLARAKQTEADLERRTLQLDAREELAKRGLPASLAASLNMADRDSMEKSLDALESAFKEYRTDAARGEALRELIREAGISEKGAEKVARYTDAARIQFDAAGQVKNRAELVQAIKTEWPEYVEKVTVKGADTPHPPRGEAATSDLRAAFGLK